MKRKKVLMGLLCVTAVLIAGMLWWNFPVSLISIQPAEVSKIEILNGTTGQETIITEAADIEHIIENLNEVSLKKQKISLGYLGYSVRIAIYKGDGGMYKQFIVNSNDNVRKDPFFYSDPSASIDYDFIQNLIKN